MLVQLVIKLKRVESSRADHESNELTSILSGPSEQCGGERIQ
jgi:hypothetical protein